jgi:predicted permease
LLVRFGSRQGELAIRSALGASRRRLVRQLVTESMVLSLLGGLAGLLLMVFSLKLVLAVVPAEIPRIDEVSLDFSVFLFAVGISVGTGLLFGVVPALVTTRQAPAEFLKAGSPATARSRQRHRLSQGLVITEITVTLILLVGAGLLVRTFLALTEQVPGFRTEDVLAVSIHVPENRYQSVPELEEFYGRIVGRLRQVPGITSVAMSNNLPISRGNARREYLVEGESEVREAQYGVISPAYFRTLDIPLIRGRSFSAADRRGNPPVAVIDEAMWRQVWPQQDPIGKRFRFNDDDAAWLTVVGVVGNIRGSGLASDPRPGFYVSYQQRAETVTELAAGRNAVILARAAVGAGDLSQPLRRGIWDVDPLQPIPTIRTLQSIISAGVNPQRFRAVLVGSFAAIALILVVAGIYGVIEFLVAERTHEFGIRMAVGATTGDIVQRVLSWGLRLAAWGLVLGTIGILIVNRYLASMLFGVTPTDPVTTLTSAMAIMVVALAACVVPARKATGIDPVAVLRR